MACSQHAEISRQPSAANRLGGWRRLLTLPLCAFRLALYCPPHCLQDVRLFDPACDPPLRTHFPMRLTPPQHLIIRDCEARSTASSQQPATSTADLGSQPASHAWMHAGGQAMGWPGRGGLAFAGYQPRIFRYLHSSLSPALPPSLLPLQVCSTRVARKVTYDDRAAPHSPFFWCEDCFMLMHYDQQVRHRSGLGAAGDC